MKIRTLAALVLTLLAVSACVVGPYGRDGGYNRGHDGGGYRNGDQGQHENDRRAWHP